MKNQRGKFDISKRMRLGAGAAALGIGASIVTAAGAAQAAPAAPREVKVEVCAEGSYTSYAKWVQAGQDLGLPHQAPGGCQSTFVLPVDNQAPVTLYIFGVDPTTHKGFEMGHTTPADPPGRLTTILWHTTGTASSHHFTYDAWNAFGQHSHFQG
jgi:hypothetical protein